MEAAFNAALLCDFEDDIEHDRHSEGRLALSRATVLIPFIGKFPQANGRRGKLPNSPFHGNCKSPSCFGLASRLRAIWVANETEKPSRSRA
jgi:hypothetical protein